MRRLTKQYLLLSSILCLGFVSCRIHKYKNAKNCQLVVMDEQMFQPVLTSRAAIKYNASIDVLKNHLSGMIVVKQTDSVTTHIVFITELGMKMFDFEVKPYEVNAVYVFEPLNKPLLINALKRNFYHLFLFKVFYTEAQRCKTAKTPLFYLIARPGSDDRFFTTDSLGLTTQELFNGRKKSSKIEYVFNKATNTYSQIKCVQYGFAKIKIELNHIEN